MYYLGKEKRLLPWDSSDVNFVGLNEALWSMADAPAAVTDKDPRSVGQYLRDAGVSPSMMSMAEAGYANTGGSTLDKLSFAYQCMNER